MPFALILDIVIAVLLVATIAYAFVLNKRLAGLRRDKQELESLAATFGQATIRAEESIGKLKITASGLNEGIDRAQALRDDLAFLVERGGAAADQLEEAIRKARKEGAVPGAKGGGGVMTDPALVAEAAERVKSQLAKGALGADQAVGTAPRGAEPRGRDARGFESRGVESRGIEPRGVEPRGVEPLGADPAETRGERREPMPPMSSPGRDADDDDIAAKSEAERELLKALRAAR